jgi:sugar O-acyltransferase (sialic acid O-acetyltransferase NeuD family)
MLQLPNNRLYIFGAGGHGRELAWLARETLGESLQIVHLVDEIRFLTTDAVGLKPKLLSALSTEDCSYFIPAVGDSSLRRAAVQKCKDARLKPLTLVHPRVEHSAAIELGEGVIVCAGSILTTQITVGDHVHINIGCSISHDVEIGEFSTISPGVRIAGHVQIGRDVFVGIGATIINGSAAEPLRIGDGATIAAGACVTRSVPALTLVAGIPAVIKRSLA